MIINVRRVAPDCAAGICPTSSPCSPLRLYRVRLLVACTSYYIIFRCQILLQTLFVLSMPFFKLMSILVQALQYKAIEPQTLRNCLYIYVLNAPEAF